MVTFNDSKPADYGLEFVRGEIYERMFEHTRFNLVFRLTHTYLDEWLVHKLGDILRSVVKVSPSKKDAGGPVYEGRTISFYSNKANATSEIEITFACISESIVFDSLSCSRCFVEKSLDDIFKACSGNKIDVRGDTGKYTIFRYNETGFNLIKRMAHEHGYWLFLKNNQWQCLRELPQSDVKELSGEIYRFGININGGFVKGETSVYNTEQNKIEKDSREMPPSGNVFWAHAVNAIVSKEHTPSRTAHFKTEVNNANQKNYTTAMAGRMAANLLFFNGESVYPSFSLGDVFRFTEKYSDQRAGLFSGRDYGSYRILELSHFFTPDAYSNAFTSIPDDHKMTPSSFTTGFVKPQLSVIDGVVNEIGKGKNSGSVKVQYDTVNGVSPFIKVMTTGAGTDRGMYFMPEQNDRVSVGFTDGHPDMPFIMGSHYNGKSRPSLDGNMVKRIKTPTELVISFNDDQNKNEIVIATKDGQNAITINYKDNHIVVESKKGVVTVAGKAINIKADDTLKMEANTISIKARSKADISAAQTEISGDSLTIIKGGIIKLN